MASTPNAAFVIGGTHGTHDPYLTKIAKFENDKWSLYGNLIKGRQYHGTISSGSLNMVIGGATKDSS